MARLHLLEIEDQPWCPRTLRDVGTSYLELTQNLADLYAPAADPLAAALKKTRARRVIDLCSGGAGPWPRLLGHLAKRGVEVEVLLTDLYPNAAAFEAATRGSQGTLSAHPGPVDATAVPAELTGFRTVFNAFHHFRPGEAKAILDAAVKAGEGIAVFEAVERKVPSMLGLLPAPLAVVALAPFFRPFRWTNLLWSWLIPLAPLLVLFDGMVSALRIYSPDELRELTREFEGSGYTWEIGRLAMKGPSHITYLIGLPPRSHRP